VVGEDALAFGEETRIRRCFVAAWSLGVAAGIVLRWAPHFSLSLKSIERARGGGLILLTASLSGESVRHDWSRECRFFFSSLKIRGSVFFTLFSFFKLLSIFFYFFPFLLSFLLSYFYLFCCFISFFFSYNLMGDLHVSWKCLSSYFFSICSKKVFLLQKTFLGKSVFSIYIVFNYIDCFMIYPFNLYLQLQNILKYLGKIPQ